MATECDVSHCKSRSLELGRSLAELQVKANKQPLQGVKSKETEELYEDLNIIIDACKLRDEDVLEIRKAYRELNDTTVLAGGQDTSKAIIKLTSKIFHSLSECDRP